eukprot:1158163-Pelagomonas_calceolata.AAC.8
MQVLQQDDDGAVQLSELPNDVDHEVQGVLQKGWHASKGSQPIVVQVQGMTRRRCACVSTRSFGVHLSACGGSRSLCLAFYNMRCHVTCPGVGA